MEIDPFIMIYGPPASGKSSLGLRLAESLRLPFYDLDELIESQAGLSIPQIFAVEGETGFRRRESAALADVLDFEHGVVALGGGALLHPENRARAEAAGLVLCLSAPFETIVDRLEASQGQRPLLDGDMQDRLQRLLEQRAAHYASFPLQLDTAKLSLSEAAWQAQTRMGMFHVTGMGKGYDVRVGEGGLDHLGAVLLAHKIQGPLAVVSDENVASIYAQRTLAVLRASGYIAHLVVIPAGEQHKTISTINLLWDAFLAAGLERNSTVIALGGGVVSDLAGFAAATYLRGIPWVAVPTTLLAMVDASLGGKTGADLTQGKNLVGAFHPPSLVLADPLLLASLPDIELRNGLAEVVKHGLIADPVLFELCGRGWQSVRMDLNEVVRRAMAVKVRTIQEDPYEHGRRACLNLGHTLGHAIEAASEYQLKHGEAVAIGMAFAARLAERNGLASNGLVDEIVETLQNLGLPTDIPAGLDRQRILNGVAVDKKRAGGKVRWVLPIGIGKVRWGIEIDDWTEIL
jgi:3-dehydroquinate synthase